MTSTEARPLPDVSSSSSSSRFSEDEILQGLLEQGVAPSKELIARLKKELDEIMTIEEQSRASPVTSLHSAEAHSKLLSEDVCTPAPQPEDPLRVMQDADALHARVRHTIRPIGGEQHTDTHSTGGGDMGADVALHSKVWTPSDIDSLLVEAGAWSERLKAEAQRIHQMELKWSRQPLFPNTGPRPFVVSTASSPPAGGDTNTAQQQTTSDTDNRHAVRLAEAKTLARTNTERRAINELSKALRTELKMSDLDDIQIPVEAYENYLRETENFQSRRLVPQQAIRTVLCPEPGLAPFRHDPVKSYEMYKKGWQKYPVPGEDKRLQLRWKVREYMLRQDIATLKN